MSPACETTCREDGDEYVLDGEKIWITNGNLAERRARLRHTRSGGAAQGHLRLHRPD